MDIQEKFRLGRESHTYRRIDSEYRVNVFLGYNEQGQMSMVVTELGLEKKVSSSIIIDVHLKRRNDNKLALSFDLLDEKYSAMFLIFCKDIINSCEHAGSEMAISTAITRWQYWRQMFGNKPKNILSEMEIKGLLGELLALKHFFIPKYGCRKAVEGWLGPLLGHKDFEIDETWFEIKSITESAKQVMISSLEQLESDIDGHLILVRLEKTSPVNLLALSLNKMVTEIANMLDDPDLTELFFNRLNHCGYAFDEEYNLYQFAFKGLECYLVSDDFPRIKRSEVSNAIGNAVYTIMINGIASFREE